MDSEAEAVWERRSFRNPKLKKAHCLKWKICQLVEKTQTHRQMSEALVFLVSGSLGGSKM
jgi:hypothetical protein